MENSRTIMLLGVLEVRMMLFWDITFITFYLFIYVKIL